jgi:hypothetical protein
MNFLEYLWYLAHKPLRVKEESKSDVYKFFKPFAKILDKAKEKIFLVRRQALIGTASGKALDKHGEGRKIKRFPDEDDEAFRRRILAKPKIAKLAGTYNGIVETIKSLGYEDVEIIPLYKEDPERWAEFVIYLKDEVKYKDIDVIHNEVIKVKQASSKPNYGLDLPSTIAIKTATETFYSKYPLCNTILCGEYPYTSTIGSQVKVSLGQGIRQDSQEYSYPLVGDIRVSEDKYSYYRYAELKDVLAVAKIKNDEGAQTKEYGRCGQIIAGQYPTKEILARTIVIKAGYSGNESIQEKNYKQVSTLKAGERVVNIHE